MRYVAQIAKTESKKTRRLNQNILKKINKRLVLLKIVLTF